MGISNISDYSFLWQNYKMPNIQVAPLDLAKESAVAEQPSERYESGELEIIPRKPDAPLEDISITFNKQDTFDHIGKDSDIHSLDVEKAISDMEKDSLLRKYQYFVGTRATVAAGNEDGLVIIK